MMAPAGSAASPGSGPVSRQLDQFAMPEVWSSSSAIVIGPHAGGQCGRYAHARPASRSRPRAARIVMAIAVNCLVTDPTWKIVPGPLPTRAARSASPYPASSSTRPSRATSTVPETGPRTPDHPDTPPSRLQPRQAAPAPTMPDAGPGQHRASTQPSAPPPPSKRPARQPGHANWSYPAQRPGPGRSSAPPDDRLVDIESSTPAHGSTATSLARPKTSG